MQPETPLIVQAGAATTPAIARNGSAQVSVLWDTRSVKADLARFKGRIESQGRENGSSSVGKGSHSGKEDQPGVDTSNQ